MTLEEAKGIFNTEEGHFYRVKTSKSDVEILTDVNQSISTVHTGGSLFIRVEQEFNHPDYIKVVE